MNIYPMYIILTTEIYIHPLRVHLLRHVLGTCPRLLWTWCMKKMLMWMKNEQRTKSASSSRGFNRYTRKSMNSWRRVKHSINLGMTSTGLIISSRLEIGYGFTSARNDWRVKEINSSPFDMDPSLFWRKVVPMIFLSCKCGELETFWASHDHGRLKKFQVIYIYNWVDMHIRWKI